MLTKWKRAVVHLECAGDSDEYVAWRKQMDERLSQLGDGRITAEEYSQQQYRAGRDSRFQGTALFLSHAGRRYLLTARHVLWDALGAAREAADEKRRLLERPHPGDLQSVMMMRHAEDRQRRAIFSIIFRVRSLDEAQRDEQRRPEYLMNLRAGVPDAAPYTYSEPEHDLALISLDQRDTDFADGLLESGHAPVTLDEIADGPADEGDEVFAIGFPNTSLVMPSEQSGAAAHWSSSWYSLPVSTFGRVAMLHDALPYFWADLSIYPGNSGGPVVSGGRVVGIVSGQALINVEGDATLRTRIPIAKIIKTGLVQTMVAEQVQKDKNSEH